MNPTVQLNVYCRSNKLPEPHYDVCEIAQRPSRYVATVTIRVNDAHTITGDISTSKKKAKHSAAERACAYVSAPTSPQRLPNIRTAAPLNVFSGNCRGSHAIRTYIYSNAPFTFVFAPTEHDVSEVFAHLHTKTITVVFGHAPPPTTDALQPFWHRTETSDPLYVYSSLLVYIGEILTLRDDPLATLNASITCISSARHCAYVHACTHVIASLK